jgi:hypothetical protein
LDPQDRLAPRWSPDGFWWWDGARWVPAAQAPMPPPPSFAPYGQPPPFELKPSPGLRPFLIVVLAIDTVLTALLALFGTIGEVQNLGQGSDDAGGIVLWIVFVVLFVLAAAGLAGVILRTAWARWVAIAAGVAACLTCLGLVLGIPIVVAAARAPIRKPAPTSP